MGSLSTTASTPRLNTPVHEVAAIGARYSTALGRLGVRTLSDLIRHVPVRYERQWAECPIRDLRVGVVGSVRGLIVATRLVPLGKRVSTRGRGPKPRFEATIEDHSGRLIVNWFNAPFLQERLQPGHTLRVQGKATTFRGQVQIVNPQWERLDDPDQTPLRIGRWRPIYRATEQLSSPAIEKLIDQILPGVLDQIVDPLPVSLVRAHAMVPLHDAFRMAHQPHDEDEAKAARRRLAFNELLLLQLGIAVKRKYNQTRLAAPPLRWSDAIDRHIRDRFPFELTGAQDRVIGQITADLQQVIPMNRLLQGDVGAGKTVVALYALLLAVANRKQGALMAPTELLAQQHYLSITAMLHDCSVRVALLSGGQSAAGSTRRATALKKIERGDYDIIIGTQALVAESVVFRDLAVVVIDEQHRFGVLQRAAFRATGSSTAAAQRPGGDGPLAALASPHCLVMTATPIPRTLSLTVFGDLDISTITEMPPGRTPVASRCVEPDRADQVYKHLAKRVARGEQAYVVVPAIDAVSGEGDKPRGGSDRQSAARQLKNVRAHAQLLAHRYFPDSTVGVIHGRFKQSTRQAIMDRFRRGKIDVLVATTVIEVGVDVPSATLMVVEHAERFGLAQLHQLRGRIGRGSHGKKSLCVFIAEPTTDEASQRLKAIVSTNDGFQIAEKDLEIRGMGDFFGTRQHGYPPLRVARIPGDMDLLGLARRDAQSIVDSDPTLSDASHGLLRRVLIQQYGDALGLIDVG